MNTFFLKVIASDRVFFEGRCRSVIVPAPDGEKGILSNHENMVIALVTGNLRVIRKYLQQIITNADRQERFIYRRTEKNR